MKNAKCKIVDSPWPHRMAMVLVCATFPLIWVGGLVTTYDAGMAVPDWPSTYGYNLFLYPWQTWVAGPFDLFIEHGHRLLASLVGLIAIAVAVVTWRCEHRTWVKFAALGALALVVFQGILGGVRVLLDDRQMAQVHGIVGPTFFAYAVFFAAITSSWWRDARAVPRDISRSLAIVAWGVSGLALFQLVCGSQLRHVSGMTSRAAFGWAVHVHVTVAIILFVMAPLLSWAGLRRRKARVLLRAPAIALTCLIVLQIALGVATWYSKYGIPAGIDAIVPNLGITFEAEGLFASMLSTAHVANGALVLGVSTLIALSRNALRCGSAGCPKRMCIVGSGRMNFAAITAGISHQSIAARLGAFVELTKPRISLLVLFSVAAAGFAAAGESTSFWLIVNTVIGTGLVAASATIANQILEIDSDRRMARTIGRPLPSGRVSTAEAFGFMAVTGFVGALYLALVVNHLAAVLGIATWLLYVLVYTPMKQRSSWNTAIGAIPGAMPVLIGWAATETPIDSRCASLFLMLFFWQFPHFMAIAWMYRRDYQAGGMKMLTVTEPSGRDAGYFAVGSATALLPVVLIPVLSVGMVGAACTTYAILATLLTLWQLTIAVGFLAKRSDQSARRLLRASLIYLPLMLILFTSFGR